MYIYIYTCINVNIGMCFCIDTYNIDNKKWLTVGLKECRNTGWSMAPRHS